MARQYRSLKPGCFAHESWNLSALTIFLAIVRFLRILINQRIPVREELFQERNEGMRS